MDCVFESHSIDDDSIVVACLDELNAIVLDVVYQPMLLCDAARPDTGGGFSEWFGFADTAVWIPARGLNEAENSKGDLAIVSNPPCQIFEEL